MFDQPTNTNPDPNVTPQEPVVTPPAGDDMGQTQVPPSPAMPEPTPVLPTPEVPQTPEVSEPVGEEPAASVPPVPQEPVQTGQDQEPEAPVE